jgi:hypothetical protein
MDPKDFLAPTRSPRPAPRTLAAEELLLLAPTRSPRPVPRVTPEEHRARAMADAEMFAALEDRADMDPQLANNALRRLGYRGIGGLRGVRMSRNPEVAKFSGKDREILIGGNFFADPVKAHEAGHSGFDLVEEALTRDPELAQAFRDAGFAIAFPPSRSFEEAIVELGDDPTASWNLPADARSRFFGQDAVVGTMAPTIEYLPEDDEAKLAEFARYNEALQQIAEEVLRRQGEPPRAVMRAPGPDSVFYQGPDSGFYQKQDSVPYQEPERGIGALFRRMLGLD